MKICGPKLSLCGLIVSVWGIIQLLCMGVFYYFHSVALLEDLPIKEEEHVSIDVFYAEAKKGFELNAMNCLIAACLYMFTLAVSGHQFYMNSRSQV